MFAVRLASCLLLVALVAPPVSAQAKKKADPGDEMLKKLTIPDAPVVPPEKAIATFKMAPGYRVELVAAEPLVQDPIAMAFDADGRLWVCEMSGYMPNVDGAGERDPVGCIAVLEDTTGSGKMDKRTVFLDKLVMPRAFAFVAGGVLVGETGKLWYCKSTKGNLHCDEKTLVAAYGNPAGNPEYNPNGLLHGLDNWIYSAQFSQRLRLTAKGWQTEPTIGRGQWGITQDDVGHLYYNSNSSLLRGDRVPCWSPSAHLASAATNQQFYKSQLVYPARITPGINRYYQLRPDGTLKSVTAACGPWIYRGDSFPADAHGNAFVCEPAGNLITRNVFIDDKGVRTTKSAYENAEFLASTDERFRPVNLAGGPDGNLYIVDMYHGILQHKGFMTPYLRKQVLERGLDKPLHNGRIYRVVHESSKPRPAQKLAQATDAELVALLSHPNAWHRETAQRLLAERADKSTTALLEKALEGEKTGLARLHVLWTLEGMNQLTNESVMTALADKEPAVRASATALSKRFLGSIPDPDMLNELERLKDDANPDVRRELVLALATVVHPRIDAILEPALKASTADGKALDTLLAGFTGREAELLAARLDSAGWKKQEPWRTKFIHAAAAQGVRQRNPIVYLRMLHLAGIQPTDGSWRQTALLDGLMPTPPKGADAPRPIKLPTVSEGLDKLLKSTDPKVAKSAEALAKLLIWPGKDGKPLPVLPPLSPKHQDLYDVGKTQFTATCAACHHPAGYGEAGKGPPLIDSDWARGAPHRLVRIVLHGLHGPISINKEPFNKDASLEMPAMAMALDDAKIAGVLTYVRREFGDGATPVEMEIVATIRATENGRTEQWTEKELAKTK
jgi:mono/diheme cytochrome c family protein/glucose/arabinose dehydrogenase